jgi:hypothetical protein
MRKVTWSVILVLILASGNFVSIIHPVLVAASPSYPLPTQITDFLTTHPLLLSREVQVLDVALDSEAVLINMS